MEQISQEEIDKLRKEIRQNRIKEVHQSIIYRDDEVIDTTEIIRENSIPTNAEIIQKPEELRISFIIKK